MLLASRTDPALRREFLETLALLANDRPSDPQLLDALGWMQHQAGRDDLARPLLELAVEHSAGAPSARFHLGSVYLASGASERGHEELRRALDSPSPVPRAPGGDAPASRQSRPALNLPTPRPLTRGRMGLGFATRR